MNTAKGDELPEDDETAYACDDCGAEFASKTALEGHEAQGCPALSREPR